MEMLELAAELKGCREQIAAYEVERAQMQQYYRRAIADRDDAKATISRLRDENQAAWDSAEYNARRARTAEAVIGKLREYAEHDVECRGQPGYDIPCSCGYNELIKEIGNDA